jgi:adenosylcobinamide kinase / adenosylcobinamide-phosphate guanylyltransferase
LAEFQVFVVIVSETIIRIFVSITLLWMTATIYHITRGKRSEKSACTQKLALSFSNNPVYLAASRIWDNEFRQGTERYKTDRDGRWQTIENEIQIPGHILYLPNRSIGLHNSMDSNLYFDSGYDS